MRRELDGIYFRIGKENICFSDLTPKQQDMVLGTFDKEALKRMCKRLAEVIKNIGDQFNIICKYEGDSDED